MGNTYFEIPIALSTPDHSGDPICIAGNFNNWNEHQYQMNEISKGKYFLNLQIPRTTPQPIEYKFLKSRWNNVELDEYGGQTANRIIGDVQEPIKAWVPRWRHNGQICNEEFQPIIEFHHDFVLPKSRKNRRVSVLLPYDYYRTNKEYPVLYLMDGQNLFEEGAPFGSWEINKKMAVLAEKNMHEVIIVCIDHAGKKRIEEYTFPSHKNEKGRGNLFLNWLLNKLMPFINKRYRTLQDVTNTGIGGSSLGGLISLMAGITHPDVFGKLMILSPSLWKIIDQIYQRLIYLPLVSHNQYIYLYSGQKEASNMTGFLRDFYQQLFKIYPANDRIHLSINEIGEHAERFWGKEFPFALKYLFY